MRNKDKPTSLDIAHLAGVSQPTVSRALRDSPLVSLKTREKIQKIARDINYTVDVNARNLRSQHTNVLALLLFEDKNGLQEVINPFFLSIVGSITRCAADHDYDVLISFQQFSSDWRTEYENSNKADGIIFLGYGDYTDYIERVRKLDRHGTHFITWGPVIEKQPGHFIGCDNRQGGQLASQHLLDLGRRHIAFIGDNSKHFPEFRDRYMGYVDTHEAANVAIEHNAQVAALSSAEDGYSAAEQMLAIAPNTDAIFCASDLIAIGAIDYLREHGKHVPADIAVIGFDDIPVAEFLTPGLTTIKQDTLLAGEALVESLLKLIDGEQIESFLIPTELIVRGSCGAR